MPKRKTHEEFLFEVKEIFGEEYIILGQYINNKTKILVKHTKCGQEFEKSPKDMIGKHSGCPYCNGNKNALYNEDWVKNNTPAPYTYISGYVGMKQKSLFYCSQCKTEFEQLPSRLINQHIYGCNCCPTRKKTQIQFMQELGENTLNHYEILEEYINIDTPIKFKHLDCNTVFYLSPDKFLHRYKKEYCPICYYKKSKGEILIMNFLKNHNIRYQKEFNFKDLPRLRFDFYLPDFNTCIEFDGKQHFEAIDFFGGEEQWVETQQRDGYKNHYCIEHNIPLYRIPYYDIDNIDYILFQIFEEKSSETIEKYKIY